MRRLREIRRMMRHYEAARVPGPGQESDPLGFWTVALQEGIREHSRYVWRRRFMFVMLIGIVLLPIFAVKNLGFNPWFLFFFFGGGAAAKAAMNKGYQATWQLAELEDPRAINVLANAAVSAEKDTREIATIGLKRILPQIKASEAGLISEDGMVSLVRLLDNNDPSLLLPLLAALMQVGDERALPSVERLANSLVSPGDLYHLTRGQWSKWLKATNMEWEQVRDAARECLPYLVAKAEQRRNSETLLRAAGDPGSGNEALLRPASATESAEEQLLRPAT